MKRRVTTLIAGVAAAALAGGAAAVAQTDSYSGHGHRADGGTRDDGRQTVTLRVAKSSKSAYLNGRAEIGEDGRRGAGDPDATGTAVFQIVDDQTISYGFTLEGADTPQIVHIHRGAPDENGPPVIEFANVPKDADGRPSGDPGTSSGSKTLTAPEELAALERILRNPRNYYVNMHTEAFPDGAVRGQLSHLLFSNR
jgi:CHRD domain